MQYSICVIDDDIPATKINDIRATSVLNSSTLQIMLTRHPEVWSDQVVKNLIETLLAAKDEAEQAIWEVNGFVYPQFYLDAVSEGNFRSDIVVIDWDYQGMPSASKTEDFLLDILRSSFCLVFVFSKVDKKLGIEEILAGEVFKPFKGRLEYLQKESSGQDQTNSLLSVATDMYAANFSFKFAGVLRKEAIRSVDKILSDMGRASQNDVKNYLMEGNDVRRDFVDFITERFRTSFAGKEIYALVDEIPEPIAGTPEQFADIAAHVWSYRLYFRREEGDRKVRRGDIVKSDEKYFMVLSADCHLGYFWNKNFGLINMIALHEICESNTDLKDLLSLCKELSNVFSSAPASLTGNIGGLPEGPFILPFVPVNGQLKNFLALPKELNSPRVPVPANWSGLGLQEKKDHPLLYDFWDRVEPLCSISEPYLTPVVQHILGTLGGIGVPDYGDRTKDILKEIMGRFTSKVTQAQFIPNPDL